MPRPRPCSGQVSDRLGRAQDGSTVAAGAQLLTGSKRCAVGYALMAVGLPNTKWAYARHYADNAERLAANPDADPCQQRPWEAHLGRAILGVIVVWHLDRRAFFTLGGNEHPHRFAPDDYALIWRRQHGSKPSDKFPDRHPQRSDHVS